MNLKQFDPELAKLIELEIQRQAETINLIPSEALCPKTVLAVLGSPLVNKYSEGEIGKRYYPGCEYYDKIEALTKERAKQLFELEDDWDVNVQPLSGTPANLAVYFGLLEPGDTIMGMSLFSGGHLSHGHKINLSGRIFNSIQYPVDSEGFLDFEQIRKLAQEHKPKIIISGYSAYPYKVNFEKFKEIAKEVKAWHLADISHIAGLIAAEVHPSPFLYTDVVTTTLHKTINGPRAAMIFFKKELAEKINRAVFPGIQSGPHNNKIAAAALSLKIAQTKEFKEFQYQIVRNAQMLARELMRYNFNLSGGGTETHLMLIDLRNKNISGTEAEELLEEGGIIVNRNSIPQDRSPFHPSGLRPGTPSITFRGMKEPEVERIADWINRIITKKEDPKRISQEVKDLCGKFPLPYID